jgi:hypothetical protein
MEESFAQNERSSHAGRRTGSLWLGLKRTGPSIGSRLSVHGRGGPERKRSKIFVSDSLELEAATPEPLPLYCNDEMKMTVHAFDRREPCSDVNTSCKKDDHGMLVIGATTGPKKHIQATSLASVQCI